MQLSQPVRALVAAHLHDCRARRSDLLGNRSDKAAQFPQSRVVAHYERKKSVAGESSVGRFGHFGRLDRVLLPSGPSGPPGAT